LRTDHRSAHHTCPGRVPPDARLITIPDCVRTCRPTIWSAWIQEPGWSAGTQGAGGSTARVRGVVPYGADWISPWNQSPIRDLGHGGNGCTTTHEASPRCFGLSNRSVTMGHTWVIRRRRNEVSTADMPANPYSHRCIMLFQEIG